MPSKPPEIAKLVANFRSHIQEYKSASTNEMEIRQKFIDPFWRAFGWDVGDRRGAGPVAAEVMIEKTVMTAPSIRKALGARIARQMKSDDLKGTDLGRFFDTLDKSVHSRSDTTAPPVSTDALESSLECGVDGLPGD